MSEFKLADDELNRVEKIKKFLKIDYPRGRAARYYANFMALRATGISNYKSKKP